MRNKQHDDEDKKVIPDGGRVVVKLAMMDSTNNFNRPGYRQMTKQARDASGTTDAQRDAYRWYEDFMTNQWRGRDDTLPITGAGAHRLRGAVGNHAPFGAYPFRPEAVGAECSVDGWPGHLVEVSQNGERWLICKPTSSDADFPHRKIRRNRFNQEEGEEELEKDKATLDRDREAAYRDYDLALASSWRVGK